MTGNKDNKTPSVELRSNNVQEILGHVPVWIVRWGITLITVIILGILTGSWFYQYPDIVRPPVMVTTENPPSPVIAKASGRIVALFVSDTQIVERGQTLAVIDNPADFEQVFQLKEKLENNRNTILDFSEPGIIEFRTNPDLGIIQTSYAKFLNFYSGYHHFIGLKYYQRKIESQNEELEKYHVYYNRLYRQRNFLKRELQLASRQFFRDSLLFARQVIPDAEFDLAEGKLLQKKHEFEQARINLSTTTIEISKLEQEILDIKQQYTDKKKELELQLIESFENLTASISTWDHQFILRSSSTGKVSFTKYWAKDQSVTEGERVLTIIPEDAGEIIGKITLEMKRSGKVKKGQKVNIKFDNYPHLEYGMVEGVVNSISLVPAENRYTVEVGLVDGLNTFYGIELEFTQEMQGTAEIITEKRRLLMRLVDPIKFIFEKNASYRKDRR